MRPDANIDQLRTNNSESHGHLLAQLEAGGESLPRTISEIIGSVRDLTFDAEGCRVVQLALQKVDQKDAARICFELHGCVRRAIASPYGNYVIQKVIEIMPSSVSCFVSEEFLGVGAEMSRHRFGCRILCRLLEHASTEPQTVRLINETLAEASSLSRHYFGHHVIESVLEHGLADQKHLVAVALKAEIIGHATDSVATYVIESALRNCSAQDAQALSAALCADKVLLLSLAMHKSGLHVVRALLKYSDASSYIQGLLCEESRLLQADPYGSRILHQLRRHTRG